jgi:hypothetical protein
VSKWRVVAAVVFGIFVVTLDTTAVNVRSRHSAPA